MIYSFNPANDSKRGVFAYAYDNFQLTDDEDFSYLAHSFACVIFSSPIVETQVVT